jgi:UDPglucose 6-dehydrogenase
MSKLSVAIVGQGFVGGSLTTVLSERGIDVYVYDKSGKVAFGGVQPELFCERKRPSLVKSTRLVSSVADLVEFCEHRDLKNFSGIYFVCVPTPMNEDGSADLSIVEDVIKCLSEVDASNATKRVVVVKSTVPPGSTEKWNERFKDTNLTVIFCPEFLTEANALDDMRNQNRIVLGGPRPQINVVKHLFEQAFPTVPIIKTSSTTAEMVKYFTNIQLAARVVLSCELAQLCEKLDDSGLNIDYDKVLEYSRYDKRLGDSHMSMNSIRGARGHCFPKDLAALTFLVEQHGITPSLLSAIQKKNLEIVPPEHRDWEQMVGRAVSKKSTEK